MEHEITDKVWCKAYLNGAWQKMAVCKAKGCFCPSYEKTIKRSNSIDQPIKRTK